jgi:nicotinate-nucleotide pyrophosphorylase (carboxylating)
MLHEVRMTISLVPPTVDAATQTLIDLAVKEDMGTGDKTVELAIPQGQRSTATVVARQPGVISGTYLLPAILSRYSPDLKAEIRTMDGAAVKAGQPVATISGPTRALLSAERVVLNFLSHLSGIATLTRKYVDAVAVVENPPAIADTRKTTPGFRTLDKYAVRCGGGVNHRMALYDGVMLKDNHLAALREQLGSNQTLAQLTAHVRSQLDATITLWLEVDTLDQLREALSGGGWGADIILLDNFTPEQMRQAVTIRDQSKIENRTSKILLEASGGVTLEILPEIAKTGIDRISIGALTHSAPILDLSMDMG